MSRWEKHRCTYLNLWWLNSVYLLHSQGPAVVHADSLSRGQGYWDN